MAEKKVDITILEFMRQEFERMRVELECWRERYPNAAIYVEEKARAKIEKREPNYPPPICIG